MKFVIGIDEVGRGSLAGPVTVAAVVIQKGIGFRVKGLGKLRDSKQLSPEQREQWWEYFRKHPTLCYSTVSVGPREIEKLNISRAANLAAYRAYRRLMKRMSLRAQRSNLSVSSRLPRSLVLPRNDSCKIFLDGGLYLGNDYKSSTTYTTYNARTVVRADEKIPAVSAASIIAKVHRDRLMTRMAKKYPAYGFEKHKGYGTAAHRNALIKNGVSSIHRLTFLKNYPRIQSNH